jgi:hypothetical protein
MLPKLEIKVKRNNLIIVIVIAVALVFLYFTVFSRRNSAPPEEPQTLILNEAPPAVDLGVASPGFEEAVLLSSLNAEAEASNFQNINGAKSLYVRFDSADNDVVRIKDYLTDVSVGDFYRLRFRAKADQEKMISFSASGVNTRGDIGEVQLSGDQETRCFEVLFQADDNFKDLTFSSTDKLAAQVWLDDFRVEKLAVSSKDEMAKLKKLACGNTTWKNVDFSSESSEILDSGDFFSRPNRILGQIFEPREADFSGVMLRVQRQGDGGKGSYRVKIYEISEGSDMPGDKPMSTSLLDYRYPPEAVKKEQEMRTLFTQNEKAISERKIIENIPTGNISQENLSPDEATKQRAQMRQDQLEIDIRNMKNSYNIPQEVIVPTSTRLDPQKKYWVGVSNEGVVTGSADFLKVSLSSQPGKLTYLEGSQTAWKERPGSLWFKTLYAKRQSINGATLASGSTVSDLGGGKGIFRYALDDVDYSNYSGLSGRKIWDLESSQFESVDAYGNYMLSADYSGGEGDSAVYKIETLYPVEKLIFRNIVYQKNIFAEFSFDGKNWEEIASKTSSDPKGGNDKIDDLVLRGDGQSRQFYLKFLPLLGDSVVKNIEMEAELKME